jgi:hypothetical protein
VSQIGFWGLPVNKRLIADGGSKRSLLCVDALCPVPFVSGCGVDVPIRKSRFKKT